MILGPWGWLCLRKTMFMIRTPIIYLDLAILWRISVLLWARNNMYFTTLNFYWLNESKTIWENDQNAKSWAFKLNSSKNRSNHTWWKGNCTSKIYYALIINIYCIKRIKKTQYTFMEKSDSQVSQISYCICNTIFCILRGIILFQKQGQKLSIKVVISWKDCNV